MKTDAKSFSRGEVNVEDEGDEQGDEDEECEECEDAVEEDCLEAQPVRSYDSTRTARMRRASGDRLERIAANPTVHEPDRAAALKEIARRAAPDLARDTAGEISSTENPLHRVTFATLRRMVVNPQSVTERRLALIEINRRADEHRNVGNNQDTRADGGIPDGSFG
jgi:hypothetical protein